MKPAAYVCSNDTVWLFKKCIYGLNDAPRSWYERVKEVLLSFGATISANEDALFLWHDDNEELFGMLVCHVDDVELCGMQGFKQK